MSMSETKKQHKEGNTSSILWLFLAILLFAVALTVTATSHLSLTDIWRNAATHQPERYSELYFDNPARLPGYAPAKKRQTVRFHIVNHEHSTAVYRYRTTVTIGGVTATHNGSAELADGQAAAEALSFTIPHPNETALITIKLVGTNQQLTFRSKS